MFTRAERTLRDGEIQDLYGKRPLCGDKLKFINASIEELDIALKGKLLDINAVFLCPPYGICETLLTCATKAHNKEKVAYLLSQGADPNVFTYENGGGLYYFRYTYPLEIAVANDDHEITALILQYNPNKIGYTHTYSVDSDDISHSDVRTNHQFNPKSIKTLDLLLEDGFNPHRISCPKNDPAISNKIKQARVIYDLENYIKKRTDNKKEYKTAITFWGIELIHFGYSRQEKLTAAGKLLGVLKGTDQSMNLRDHLHVLQQGDLGMIFSECQKSYQDVFSKKPTL